MSTPNLLVRDATGAQKTLAATDTTGSGGPLAMAHNVVDSTNTYYLPTGDSNARGIYIYPTDGTNNILTASLANLQAYLSKNSQLCMPPGMQIATANITTGTTTPDASLSAPGASKIYVVQMISISLAAASAQAPLLFELIQDAAGTPVVLWQGALAAVVNGTSSIHLTGLSLPQTVSNKTLDLKVATGTIVSGNYITVTVGASIAQ